MLEALILFTVYYFFVGWLIYAQLSEKKLLSFEQLLLFIFFGLTIYNLIYNSDQGNSLVVVFYGVLVPITYVVILTIRKLILSWVSKRKS